MQPKRVGLHTVWEVDSLPDASQHAVPPADYAGAVLSHTVRAHGLKRGALLVPAKVKAVCASHCAQLALCLTQGVVASVELYQCQRTVLTLSSAQATASYLRLDDCSDVLIQLPQGPPPQGLRLLTSGCHNVRIAAGGAAHQAVPDTLCTTLAPGLGARSCILQPGTGTAGFGDHLSAAPPQLAPCGAKRYDVVIVGAGVAGLAAAAALPDSLSVCILDGRTRLGGRVCGERLGHCEVDAGAAWLHGLGQLQREHPACALLGAAATAGAHAFPAPGNPWLRPPSAALLHMGSGQGSAVAAEEEDAAWAALLQGMASAAAQLCPACRALPPAAGEGRGGGACSACAAGDVAGGSGSGAQACAPAPMPPYPASVHDLAQRHLNATQPQPALRERLEWRLRLLCCWYGISSPCRMRGEEVSCVPPAEGGSHGDYAGPHLLPAGGMSALIRALSCTLNMRGTALQLGASVAGIDTCGHRGGGVEVTLASGQQLSGACVLLTIPFPCLAASCAAQAPPPPSPTTPMPAAPQAIRFTPPLPSWKAQACNDAGVRLAGYKKVFLYWPQPWWPASWPPFLALQRGAAFVCVENYLALCGKPVLVGIAVLEEVESGPPASSFSLTQTLLALLEDSAACAGLGSVPAPMETLVTSWERDALAGCGAYATAAGVGLPVAADTEAAITALCRPVPCGDGLAGEAAARHDAGSLRALLAAQGGLFFAGEALDAEHMGSVHGAMASGRRAAKDIAAVWEQRRAAGK